MTLVLYFKTKFVCYCTYHLFSLGDKSLNLLQTIYWPVGFQKLNSFITSKKCGLMTVIRPNYKEKYNINR
jgi:hypothetical protein